MPNPDRPARPRVELAVAMACLVASVLGVGLVLAAWQTNLAGRAVLAVVGVVLAVGGAWFSGFFHDADDPQHPLRRFH